MEIFSKNFDFLPKNFKDACTYYDLKDWKITESANALKKLYISKFGLKIVSKRIPENNWKRADICSQMVSDNLPLLDIGSGLGEFVNLFALTKDKSITSVDIKDWPLFYDFTDKIQRIYKNIFDLSVENTCDIVTCFEVIEHLPPNRLNEAINKLRSLAKKKLFISVPFMEPLPMYKGHFTNFDPEKLLDLFPDAQFTIFDKGTKSSNKILAWIMCEIRY